MSALDHWDELEERIDRVLGEEPPDLEDLYDPAVLAAIDARGEAAGRATASPWRGGLTAGALVVGMVHGVRDVLDTDDDDPVVEEIDEILRASRREWVSVHLAWGNPQASVAVIRPWLAP